MSDFVDRIAGMSPKRLALLAMELQERLEAGDDLRREPIAIVGLGVRFPGADSPAALARLLAQGTDAIRDVPSDRWDIDAYFDANPDVPDRMNTRHGGFLDDVSRFDPAHFGISPREAVWMDPQQRLVLEVAWEALEHAGLAPDRMAGTPTGVFLGISTFDYGSLLLQGGGQAMDLYASLGGSHAIAAGRLSFILGLHGPSVAVDTACSSSLVAVHLACQSLRAGECDSALAGGVNVICAPETTLMLSRARMMAPDGRCKTFDARADGFVRGEGCGVVVLKRLSVAQAAGDRVLAVIRGSAVNQDGRSGGLTVPNGPSQEAVIRAALSNAGVPASSVGYVEAHGTGTALGDPIELRALGAVYGAGRDAHSAVIASSIKTNVGHLEAAAGVAGMAKTVLALQQERIPAHLHLQQLTPHVDWATLGVRIPAAGGEAWARSDVPRRAGVSSFGFSGTNAHVILEEAPASGAVTTAAVMAERLCLMPLAARTATAVRELAGRYAAHLKERPTLSLADMCDEAAAGRAQLVGSRAVVLARATVGATDALVRLAATTGAPVSEQFANATLISADSVVGEGADVAFVFTGQGGAHAQMGRALFDDAPVFRDAMTRLDAPFRDATGLSLLSVVYGDDSDAFARPDVSSAALVAFQIALVALWRSYGVEPAAVAGHSLGEYAAAVTAGVMSAGDALRLVAARGRAVATLPAGLGAMLIVDATQARIEAIIGQPVGAPSTLEIAATNAPEQVVLSGPTPEIERVEAALGADEIRVRRLNGIAHAYHSAQLDPLLGAYLVECDGAAMRAPVVEWVSCLSGEVQSATEPVAARYWIDQMRQPVQWHRVVSTLATRGVRVLIEIGPTAVLAGLSRASLESAGVKTAVSLPSMRSTVDAWSTMLETLGRGWVRGMAVDWTQVVQGTGQRAPIPTYPFQRQRYWLPANRAHQSRSRIRSGDLLGPRLSGPVASYAVSIGADAPSVLREHVVHGRALVAGSAFIDIALSAATTVFPNAALELHDLRLLAPLEVGAGEPREAVLSFEDGDDGQMTVTLSSADAATLDSSVWSRHARARVVRGASAPPRASGVLPAVLQSALPEVLDHATVYAAFRDRGITLGTSVRGVQQLWRRDGEALSRLHVDHAVPSVERRAAVLDAALQTLDMASPQFNQRAGDGPVRALARIGTARCTGAVESAAWCHATMRDGPATEPWIGSIVLLDAAGVIVAAFEDVALMVPHAGSSADRSLSYRLAWEAQPRASTGSLPTSRVLADLGAARLVALGDEHQFADYDQLIPALESAALDYARTALATLGIQARGVELSDDALQGVVPQHRQLVRRLAMHLHASPVAPGSVATTSRDEARALGRGEMLLLERCGPALAGVLRGSDDPLQLLFPQGSFEPLDQIYRDSAFAKTYNGALRDVVRAEVAARRGAPIRILEIGAGTGGTTAYVLEALPTESHYVFSDLSPLFLERARARFGDRAGIEYARLDIEQDPIAQGFAAASFDLIIAANVLHATADIHQTLTHVRSLAAPGALLLLLEGTAPSHWVDLTFGLTDGWWRFTDRELRPDHPLISAAEWVRQLERAGFGGAADASPGQGAGQAFTTQALIVGRRSLAGDVEHPVLVFADAAGVGEALAVQLESSETPHAIVRRRGDETDQTDQVERDVAAFRAQHVGPVSVVYLWALDVTNGVAEDDATQRSAQRLVEEVPLAIMRAVATDGPAARLCMATRGAQSVVAGDALPAPEQAPLWGWSRGFALEQPLSGGGCIDLDPQDSHAVQARAVLDELQQTSDEDQVAIRGGSRLVARLVAASVPEQTPFVAHADGAYLITGGTGGVGLRVAQWLVEQGAGEIVLVSRNGLDTASGDARVALLDTLRATGTAVHVVKADVSDADVMATLFARFGSEWNVLRGVVHAAVQTSAAPILQLTAPDRAAMRASKVQAARLLHQHTQHLPLDFFVVFSSTTTVLGAHGLAHYSAANQYLDALAYHRRSRGHRATSIAWGAWDVIRVASAEWQAGIVRGGLRQMASPVALELLGRVIASGDPFTIVADVDWQTLVPIYEARRARPLIHALAISVPGRVEPRPPHTGHAISERSRFDRIREAAPLQRTELLEALVRHEVAAVLGYANDDGIPVDRGFFELGLDSLLSVELKRRLEAAVGATLPSTLTFNYPNVLALAGFLAKLLLSVPAVDAPLSPPPAIVKTAPLDRDTDDLTDDELEAQLLVRLEQLRGQ